MLCDGKYEAKLYTLSIYIFLVNEGYFYINLLELMFGLP